MSSDWLWSISSSAMFCKYHWRFFLRHIPTHTYLSYQLQDRLTLAVEETIGFGIEWLSWPSPKRWFNLKQLICVLTVYHIKWITWWKLCLTSSHFEGLRWKVSWWSLSIGSLVAFKQGHFRYFMLISQFHVRTGYHLVIVLYVHWSVRLLWR